MLLTLFPKSTPEKMCLLANDMAKKKVMTYVITVLSGGGEE